MGVFLALIINIPLALSQFMPNPYPMPYSGAMPYPGAMPGPMPYAGGMPAAMPMPMQPANLPMVVMPFHPKSDKDRRKKSNKTKKRHRRPRNQKISEENSSDDYSENDSDCDMRRNMPNKMTMMRGKKRRQVLTPVVSYITKHGYVVYQKKIKNNEPDDWMDVGEKVDFRNNHNHRNDRSSRANRW